jgi:hypothetical protein
MVGLRAQIRSGLLALLVATAGILGAVGYARSARAAEFAQDFPKSYSDLMKMKPMDVMHMMDTDKKGYVTKEEFMKFYESMFDKMDKNKDGKLVKEEWMGESRAKH